MICHICEGTYIDRRVNKFRREPLPVELDGDNRLFTVYVYILAA